MPALRDLTGQRFGRLTVLHRAENGDGEAHWLCGCECGEKRVVRGQAFAEASPCPVGVWEGRGVRRGRPLTGNPAAELIGYM
jgi:hypothetical protein